MAISLTSRASPKVNTIISIVTLLIFLPLLLLAVGQTVVFISRARGKPANISVDTATSVGTFKTDFYHAFAQGGEEATDMIRPVLSHVRTLRPKLIRIDHVFTHYDVVMRKGDALEFRFDTLDPIIDSILAAGAKPVISLSFMPPAIARGGNITNPPNNWSEWALVVEKTIEHFSGRLGKDISGIYYEVWNEPDHEQFGTWGLGGERNYLTLYEYAAQGAANATNVQPFSLGGPATTGLYRNWIEALVESGYRLDFLSWHSYNSDPQRFTDDQRNLISWLLRYPNVTLIPKLITEFGFTGEKDVRYGGSYAAAYTAAVVRQLAAGGPTYLFSFQLKDGPAQAAGDGWGLITHEDNGAKPKPRHAVFAFLDALAGERLTVSGEGTWVSGLSSRRDGVTRVLLINFDPDGNHSENVPVSVEGLQPGNYTVRERVLLGRDVTYPVILSGFAPNLTRQVFMPAQSVALLEIRSTL